MEIYNNHKILYVAALSLFVGLTLFAAVIPAYEVDQTTVPLPKSQPLSNDATLGKAVFIREGCVACHSQQVRNVDMDKMWGNRPSIAADYARLTRTDIWRNTASLMGSERTGPDLTNIGSRQPSVDWNFLHLYNPRSVVSASVMPAYPWLFEEKEYPYPEDIVVNVPDEFKKGVTGKIVATADARHLVAFLQSLKQVALPDGKPVPIFLNTNAASAKAEPAGTTSKLNTELDGKALYAQNCQACHQENGQGLVGAFPALKDSKVVADQNPEVHFTIIMNGYNGRVSEGYGVMPPVGTNNNLKPEEIAAIMNYERTSWGNKGRKVTVTEIKEMFNKTKSAKTSK